MSGGEQPIADCNPEDVEERKVWLSPHDMDHLNAGAPAFVGVGDDLFLTIQAVDWDELEAIREGHLTTDSEREGSR